MEPYVVVADVYNLPGHIGRGGWTWYTGSASWVYRVWVEGVLGFKLRGEVLEINPVHSQRLARIFDDLSLQSSTYEIRVENPDGIGHGVLWIEVDGQRARSIKLLDDGQTHQVTVRLGEAAAIGKVLEADNVNVAT